MSVRPVGRTLCQCVLSTYNTSSHSHPLTPTHYPQNAYRHTISSLTTFSHRIPSHTLSLTSPYITHRTRIDTQYRRSPHSLTHFLTHTLTHIPSPLPLHPQNAYRHTMHAAEARIKAILALGNNTTSTTHYPKHSNLNPDLLF